MLVVEDDQALRRMLVRSLQTLGEVVGAGSVAEARAVMATRAPPTVIVTDVMMPGTSGIDFLRQLRVIPRTRTVPVVVLSAKGDPRSLVDAINAGARHYLIKPFATEQLLAKVERLLLRGPQTLAPPSPSDDLSLEIEVVVDETG